MPTGVTVAQNGRIFINFPRWGDPVPFTVAEIIDGKPVAYPDAEINKLDKARVAETFVSVQSVVVDPRNRLWALDTGSIELEPVIPKGPKLVGIDLATNKIFKTITFPPDVVQLTSYLNDIRFDLRKGRVSFPLFSSSKPADSSRQFWLMLSRDPVLQELNRRLVAERGVATTPVVKHFDVVEQIGDGCGAGCVARAVYPFVLQAVKEALRRRIVPAVSLAAHRANHAVQGEFVLQQLARVLAASIRVMDEPRRWPSAEPCHRQRIGHDVGRHARLDRPAHDLAVEEIQNDRQVQPAFIGPDVREIGAPSLVRRRRLEVSVEQIRRHRQRMPGICRCLVAPLVPSPDAVLAHQPLNPLLADWKATPPNLFEDSRRSIGAFELGMNGADHRQQLRIGQALAVRGAAAFPGPDNR